VAAQLPPSTAAVGERHSYRVERRRRGQKGLGQSEVVVSERGVRVQGGRAHPLRREEIDSNYPRFLSLSADEEEEDDFGERRRGQSLRQFGSPSLCNRSLTLASY